MACKSLTAVTMSQGENSEKPFESDKLLQYISAFSICFIAIYITPQSTDSLQFASRVEHD